jgi:TolB-like protein/Tfp pilus assembly protein PilF
MTPEGLRRESDLAADREAPLDTGRRIDRMILGALVLAVVLLGADRVGIFDSAQDAGDEAEPQRAISESDVSGKRERQSIAVLPFVNMSEDEANQYFSEGISEEILNVLAKVDGLRVASRTSSFAFKNQPAGISEIAQKLGVSYILEGSVRKAGTQVRITAQLIDVAEDAHLWSESYDKTLADVFSIQSEISSNIVTALRKTLGETGNFSVPVSAQRPTENLAAYEHYLQGRYWLQNRILFRSKGLKQGLASLQAAIDLDPEFAQAHATLAATYAVIPGYAMGDGDTSWSVEQANELSAGSANRALEIDPDMADAHATLGMIERDSRRWATAVERFRRAVDIDPTNIVGHLWYGILLVQLGHIEAGKDILLTAVELDPASPIAAHWLADSYRILGDSEQSRFHGQRALDLGGYSFSDGVYLYHLQRGEYEEAIGVLEYVGKMLGNDVNIVRPLVDAVRDPVNIPALVTAAIKFNELIPNDDLRQYYLDIPDATFVMDSLERAAEDESLLNYTYRLWEPQFTEYRNSAPFKDFIRKVGLFDYYRENRWPDVCRADGDGDFVCD